jgi:hypothetical protein
VAACAAKKKKKAVEPAESACGRPLGLQFHHKTGDMYIADAYLGLMRVGRRGGLAKVVATEAAGVPFNFLNGVDVDQKTGDVYFTDSSTAYQRRYASCAMHGNEISTPVMNTHVTGVYAHRGLFARPAHSHLRLVLLLNSISERGKVKVK